MRRLVIAGFVAAAMVAAQAPAVADDVVLDEVASGLSSPVFVDAPDGDDRLFIVERRGWIRILDNGSVLPTPFLDIDAKTNGGGERGLLGMAFHPDYGSNGRFYVYYTNTANNSVLAEYTVSGNPDVADAGSERILLTVNQPAGNHNGGMVAFGSDGYLYWGLGDGGSQHDPDEHGQNTSTLLGSILRVRPDTGAPAPGNPFGNEIWAYGVRNPWRFSFDADTGDLYIGDVGQDTREEISVLGPSQSGANLGWDGMEGTFCHEASSGCPPGGHVPPVHEYSHNGGGAKSVTGGYVYRGSELPQLDGVYFYTDVYDSDIMSFVYNGGSATQHQDWSAQLPPVPLISSFGTDGHGELYAVSLAGSVYKFASGATRLAGATRYGTAAAVSEQAFPTADVAYVVVGTNWPDALVAASRGDGPVLLVQQNSIPSVIRSELSRLAPLDEIFVVGGTAAVSASVEAALAPYATEVTRLAGATRYETAAAFSTAFHGAGSGGTVYVATGENYPDALVAAAAAGDAGAPLLLVGSTTIPGAIAGELARLAPAEIVIVGGTVPISNQVEADLGAYAPVRRLSGQNRYATAAAVSSDSFTTANTVYVATGLNAPDALVAAAAAIAANGPVLLTADTSVPGATASELSRLGPTEIFIVGGPSAISYQVQADLSQYEQ